MKARVVVLAASALESVRILLNSGVANSSGKVGKYIMDTVGAGSAARSRCSRTCRCTTRMAPTAGTCIRRGGSTRNSSPGSWASRAAITSNSAAAVACPAWARPSGLEWLTGGTYGKKFKEDARRYYGSFVCFSGRGEMIPNDDSYAELDPKVKDKFGIPVLRFHWKWSEHETRQAAHMQKTAAEIIDAMGGRIGSAPQSGEKAIKQGGVIIHEVGGAIMGNDPKTSVTNSFGQCWDMKNLFITDGATLCSNADKNPTLTIMALAWRASDEMLRQMKRKEL